MEMKRKKKFWNSFKASSLYMSGNNLCARTIFRDDTIKYNEILKLKAQQTIINKILHFF